MAKEKNQNIELYKYRSLEDFKRLLDILINNRLYASKYSKLNDIREGIYTHDGSISEIKIEKIKQIKQNIKICSLSINSNCSMMWANYADNHEGICIKVEIDDKKAEQKRVIYGSILTSVQKMKDIPEKSIAKEILTCKEECWRCEEEMRVFKDGFRDKKTFVKVSIKEIILGKRIKADNEKLLKAIVKKIDSSITFSKES